MPAKTEVTYAQVRRARATARLLAAIARGSGRPSFSIKTFDSRFRIQKAVYLARKLQEPAALPYSYGLHISGPYCPQLAEDYYLLTNAGLDEAEPSRLLTDETAVVFAEADTKGRDFMEALATAVTFVGSTGNVDDGIRYATGQKPHIEAGTWPEVRAFLVEHPRLTMAT